MSYITSFAYTSKIKSLRPLWLAFVMIMMTLTIAYAQVPRFLTPDTHSVPGASMAVLADLNGDGILDIVTANGYVFDGSGVSVLLGKKNGAFQPAKSIVAAGNPNWVVIGDFNNDGKLDIAVGNEPNPNFPPPNGGPPVDDVSILLGKGDGTFLPAIETPTLGALTMAAADFNGDGKLDLAIEGNNGPVQILLGNGDGTFTVTSTTVNGLDEFIFAGDFNHDGKQDFLAGRLQMLGNGDGTFNLGQALPITGLQTVADVNGDGIPDLLGLSVFKNVVSSAVAFGLPDGTWSPSFISNFNSTQNVVAADFDGDRKVDIFGAGKPAQGVNQSVGGLFLGHGDGFFTLAVQGFGFVIDGNHGLVFPAFSAAGDLDGNSSPDVVMATGTGVQIYRNTFGHPPLLAQLTTSSAAVVGGTTLTGAVSLGGPAPAGGALVALSSNDLSATFPNGATVRIPAGSQSASFTIATKAVSAATPIIISATYHAVKQTARFTIVAPFSLKSISTTPASLIGIFGGAPAVGTVTLTGPAADGTTVTLASALPNNLSVPASVSVAPGATTATFPVTAFHVAADTPVGVSGTLQGTTVATTVTVRKETTTVTITKAQYTVSKSLLSVEATSTDRVGSLQIFNAITGAFVGNIPLVNVGKFVGQLSVNGPFTSVAAQSSVGGVAIASVSQK